MAYGGNYGYQPNAGDMKDLYDIGKDSIEAYMGRGSYPAVKAKCQRNGCKKSSSYWCFHCDSSYCEEHEDSHNHGGTKCNGIKKGWVISSQDMEKGRCDRIIHKHNWNSNALAAQLPNCPCYVEYYCAHCGQWYCYEHSDDHSKGLTKCDGIKNGEVKSVSAKGHTK